MSMVLLFNVAEENHRRIEQLAALLGAQTRLVSKDHYGLTMADLCAGQSGSAVLSPDFSEDMLVMAGFSDQSMNLFLNGLKRMGVKVRLKAILTPTNEHWTASQLRTELLREEAAILGKRQGP